MKKTLTILLFALLSGNSFALDIKLTGDSKRITDKAASPWFGRVVESSVRKGRHGETVIEFYCQKLALAGQAGRIHEGDVIQVLPSTGNGRHFVATLRSPNISLAKAKEILIGLSSGPHYYYSPKAIVVTEGYYGNKKAPFLAGDLIVSDKFIVESRKGNKNKE